DDGYAEVNNLPDSPQPRAGTSAIGSATRANAARRHPTSEAGTAATMRWTPAPNDAAMSTASGAMNFWLSRSAPPPAMCTATNRYTGPVTGNDGPPAARNPPAARATSAPALPRGSVLRSTGQPAAATTTMARNTGTQAQLPRPGGARSVRHRPPSDSRLPARPNGESDRAAKIRAAIPLEVVGTVVKTAGTIHTRL